MKFASGSRGKRAGNRSSVSNVERRHIATANDKKANFVRFLSAGFALFSLILHARRLWQAQSSIKIIEASQPGSQCEFGRKQRRANSDRRVHTIGKLAVAS